MTCLKCYSWPLQTSKILIQYQSLQTIQAPLLDRLELISIPGYSREEKIQIAKSHLVPKQLNRHGMDLNLVEFENPDESISQIISDYTAEAGVR